MKKLLKLSLLLSSLYFLDNQFIFGSYLEREMYPEEPRINIGSHRTKKTEKHEKEKRHKRHKSQKGEKRSHRGLIGSHRYSKSR